MNSLENKDEELAFYQHDSNRAVAVVWPTIVENRLSDALRAYMRKDKKVAQKMFEQNGALSNFGNKILLGYMLGLYEDDLRHDLDQLRRIRNSFAHKVEITTFETSPISDHMDSMNVLRVHRELLESLKKENPTQGTRKTMLFVLTQELSDYRNSFHLCVRAMIHKIVDAEKKLLAAQDAAQKRAQSRTAEET